MVADHDEDAAVMANKTSRLIDIGFNPGWALLLADGLIDIHLVEDLVAHGCTLQLAADIAL